MIIEDWDDDEGDYGYRFHTVEEYEEWEWEWHPEWYGPQVPGGDRASVRIAVPTMIFDNRSTAAGIFR